MRVRTLYVSDGKRLHINNYPNFHKSGSIKGMKEKFYGKDALLVRCGEYIYNVSAEIYYQAYWGKNMKELKASEEISRFLKFSRTLKAKYLNALANIELLDKATQDCLHQMELGNSDDARKILPKLTKIRRARRIYKDYKDAVDPFFNFIIQTDYTKMMNKLDSDILGKVRFQEKMQTNRKYYPRVIEDLPFLKKLEESEK